MARATKRKKAKKAAPAKARAKTRVKGSTKPADKMPTRLMIRDTGPVTLDEARALARAKRPALAVQAIGKTAAPAASPASVGAARQKLRKEQREERARRIREYKATMEIMKSRGARPPRSKGIKTADGEPPVEGGEPFVPLQIFAEGDSWFDYPVPFFGGSIIPRLEQRLGVPILNLAKAGDEARYMLGVEERAILKKHLTDGCPAGGPWDALLFSGGGNDIVGNPMALWVKDWNAAIPPADHIKKPRFDAALALVLSAYEDLIALRDQISPTTHLVFQTYDFAIPDGRGICGFGPWLKPTFDLCKFPTLASGQTVVKAMLQQFAALLTSLIGPKVTVINGQGTLTPQTGSWHNELHPAKAGFETFADIFKLKLKQLFPDRVA
jgi:hypothetical protein